MYRYSYPIVYHFEYFVAKLAKNNLKELNTVIAQILQINTIYISQRKSWRNKGRKLLHWRVCQEVKTYRSSFARKQIRVWTCFWKSTEEKERLLTKRHIQERFREETTVDWKSFVRNCSVRWPFLLRCCESTFLRQKRIIPITASHRIYNRTKQALLRERIYTIRRELARVDHQTVRFHLSLHYQQASLEWLGQIRSDYH